MRPLCLAFAFSLFLPMAAAQGADQPREPELVLFSLETFYAAGDVEAVKALYASDYTFLSQQGNEVGAAWELKGLAALFADNTVALHFERDFRLKALAEPGTWVIPDIRLRTEVSSKGGEFHSEHDVSGVATLYLRRNPDTGLVQIYRWIDQPMLGDD